MKRVTYLLTGAAMLMSFIFIGFSPHGGALAQSKARDGELRVTSSPALHQIAEGWAEGYNSYSPNSQVKVYEMTGKTSPMGKLPSGDIILVSDLDNASLVSESGWKMVIGRNPVVPVASIDNPQLEKIKETGLSELKCSSMLGGYNPGVFNGILIQDEPSVIAITGKFCGLSESSLAGSRFGDIDELSSLLKANPEALAFVRLSDLLTSDKSSIKEGFAIVPVDINNNGKIDPFEDVYESSSAFLRGVWLGKYPRGLVEHLYLLSENPPSDEEEASFLAYLVLNGNKTLIASGYSSPVPGETQTLLASINRDMVAGDIVRGGKSGVAGIVLIGFIVLLVVIPAMIIRTKNQRIDTGNTPPHGDKKIFGLDTLNNPKGLMYDRSHTWSFMERDGNVKIGIDDFIKHVAGPVSKIKLLNAGDRVKKGEKIIILSNQGRKLYVKSPVSGIITDVNESIIKDPSRVNDDPYTGGWLYRIEPFNWQVENSSMMMNEAYLEWIKSEFSRLKDFLTSLINAKQNKLPHPVLADGGEIFDNTLCKLGAEVWEEFQYQFIDKTKNMQS
jgi:glycine cleavage system H lipoate-binding protein/ABC-type phosphate transport system substrate-binding protein